MGQTAQAIIFVIMSNAVLGSKNPQCPNECICGRAPLRAASFVLTWMTSWGEDDLPDVHPNEVLSSDMMTSSATASDAKVDVDIVGLHATCSIHQTTNITRMLASLPSHTMVLSILQSPGCNSTIVDGGQLFGLKSLRALHLQGYAHTGEKQVSEFTPNYIPKVMAHKKLLHAESKKDRTEEMRDLRLALAEDALQPLENLQLLNLQYVRFVASLDARRSRRYSSEPLDSATVLDMPLAKFLRFADRVNNFQLPLHFRQFFEERESIEENQSTEDNTVDNHIHLINDKYKLPRRMFITKDDDKILFAIQKETERTKGSKKPRPPHLNEIEIMPYEIYHEQVQSQLAPFQGLKELKYLRVTHASLDKVGPELLEGLHQLHTLTLEYNSIKIIPQAMFFSTPHLRHLSLAHNSILLLEKESLEGLTKLLTLDLDYNQLSVLGPTSLPLLPSLKSLRVKENPITLLLPDTFTSINSTESLDIGSHNVAIDLHENSFRFLSKLNNLALNNVTLVSVQKTLLKGMPNVQHLAIHGTVPKIDYDAFSMTYQLRTLNLSRCHLSHVSMDAFFGMVFLVKLDLSINYLTNLSPGTFDHLTNLKELYLHHNLLSVLPLGIFLPIPAKLIQLHGNPWHCTCDLLQLRPSITNIVVKESHLVCQWDDKLATVCSKSGEKLVYDARVAPLCTKPSELAGIDVYHAALRHLKCSKYHWDHQIIAVEKKTVFKPEIRAISIAKTEKSIPKEVPNWLPLTAFTPEPIEKEDILDVAVREGLEEVTDSSIVEPANNHTNEEETDEYVIQNDQPWAIKKLISKKVDSIKYHHKEQKRKMKLQLRAMDLKRKAKKLKMIQMLNIKTEDKSKMKALLVAKKKSFIDLPQESVKSAEVENLKSYYLY